MLADKSRDNRSRKAYCTACREEFLTYNMAAILECPSCGRPVRSAFRRRLLPFGILLLVVAIAGGAVAFWLLRRSP